MLKRVLAIFFLACASVWGQAQPPSAYPAQIITYQGAPFGVCDVYQVALNVTNGTFMWCNPSTRAWTNPFSGTPTFTSGLIAPTIGPSAAQQHTIPAVASDTFALLGATQTITGPKTFSQQITSSVSTGTAPFSIASTTQVTNLNAQLHGGLAAPASAIVGISDTQTLTNKTLTSPSVSGPTTTGTDSGTETLTNKTLTSPTITNPSTTGTDSGTETLVNKTLTSPTINTPTLDGFGATHVASQVSAATNFGTSLSTQTVVSNVPSTGIVAFNLVAVQSTAGVGCSASTNSVQATLSATAPGGTVQTSAFLTLQFTGNGSVDQGAGQAGNNGLIVFAAKAGTAMTYTTSSTLGSTGCSTLPQYTVYAKAIF